MDSEFLLYPIFEELRRQGVPLGISEYLVVLKLMREGGGRGLEDKESLQRICRLLWAKSPEDQELFDQVFSREITARLNTLSPLVQTQEKLPTTSQVDQQQLADERNPEPLNLPKQKGDTTSPIEQVEQDQSLHYWLPQRLPLPDEITLQSAFEDLPHNYQLTPRLPIDRRDMIGIWRHLRRLQREGPLEELDVQGTIDSICHSGLFIRPVLRPRRRNQARLVLLIDQSSSMQPFALLLDALIESILRSGLHRLTSLFYFENCPVTHIFETPKRIKDRLLAEVLAKECRGQSVLIISDAGAARGGYKSNRVEETRAFLQELREHTYLYAWLNPMPPERWSRTTAEDISMLVPMYHLDRDGVNDAVNILRGYPFPKEIRFYA